MEEQEVGMGTSYTDTSYMGTSYTGIDRGLRPRTLELTCTPHMWRARGRLI